MVEISDEDFEELVGQALDTIPRKFLDRLINVAILIEDHHPDSDSVMGLYSGVALPDRTSSYSGLPATITIYRESLKNYCYSRDHLAREVTTTVCHEVGHHFGLDDDDLHRLGWG